MVALSHARLADRVGAGAVTGPARLFKIGRYRH